MMAQAMATLAQLFVFFAAYRLKGGSWSWKESRLLLSQVAMVILLFFLEIGRPDFLFSRRYAMTTSTALS